MNDFCTPPKPEAKPTKPKLTKLDWIFFWVALVVTSGVAVLATQVIPNFVEVFGSLGIELPMPTSLLIEYHWMLWFMPVLVVALFVFIPPKSWHGGAGFSITVFALLLVPVIVVCLYLPIFFLC